MVRDAGAVAAVVARQHVLPDLPDAHVLHLSSEARLSPRRVLRLVRLALRSKA